MPEIKPKSSLKRAAKSSARPKSPVWAGPEDGTDRGGITNTLLGRYLCCKERFRLQTIEGLKTRDTFSHRLEYGNLWHKAEEGLAKHGNDLIKIFDGVEGYCNELLKKYSTNRPDIEHWFKVCQVQFPIYVKHWANNPDVKERTPLFQEQVFRVPYKLPSERVVYLRGKWDAGDIIGKGNDAGIYLQENKSKGDIDEGLLKRQLRFDLQTMLYFIALKEAFKGGVVDIRSSSAYSILGVRYNVIRRPLSGGKGTIVQKKPTKANPDGESEEEYYGRVGGIIDGTEKDSKGQFYPGPSYFFMRWKIEITDGDVKRFKDECLHPILENVADDWEWWDAAMRHNQNPFDYLLRAEMFPFHRNRHYIHPYGVYSPLAEGLPSELDEYLHGGSQVGLGRVTNLFPELT